MDSTNALVLTGLNAAADLLLQLRGAIATQSERARHGGIPDTTQLLRLSNATTLQIRSVASILGQE